jgi:hypothetical protein
VVYWAQSTEELLVMVKLQTAVEAPECRLSFERDVALADSTVRAAAYCYQDENDITRYDTLELELAQPIIAESSKFEWRGDGRVVLTLKKAGGAGFQRRLLGDARREVELQVWWEMREKHIEQLEEYIHEDRDAKEDL